MTRIPHGEVVADAFHRTLVSFRVSKWKVNSHRGIDLLQLHQDRHELRRVVGSSLLSPSMSYDSYEPKLAEKLTEMWNFTLQYPIRPEVDHIRCGGLETRERNRRSPRCQEAIFTRPSEQKLTHGKVHTLRVGISSAPDWSDLNLDSKFKKESVLLGWALEDTISLFRYFVTRLHAFWSRKVLTIKYMV